MSNSNPPRTIGVIIPAERPQQKPAIHMITSSWIFDTESTHIITTERIYNPNKKNFLDVSAFWDTGATSCAISKRAAYKLGLEPFDKLEFETMAGNVQAEVAHILFQLPNGTLVKTEASITDMDTVHYDFVVGMSVIRQGRFCITPKNGGFNFTFSVD